MRTDGNSKQERAYNQLEMNYTKMFDKEGRKLTFDLQYDSWDSTMKWSMSTKEVLPIEQSVFDIYTYSTDSNNDIAMQTDYVTPFGENYNFELGIKYEKRNVKTSFQGNELIDGNYELIDGLDNDLKYDERIVAAYLQLGNDKGKFNYLLGLRMESTSTQITGSEASLEQTRDYTDLFPTLNMNYVFSEKTNIGFNYSHRINRPSLRLLNPFAEMPDFNTRFKGNPNLKPAYTDIIEFSLLQTSGKLTLNPSIYYSETTDDIILYTQQNEDNIFISSIVNIEKETRLGFELSASYNPLKWLGFSGDFNSFRFEQKGIVDGRNISNKNSSWSSSLSTRIKMGNGFSFQNRFNYNGASKTAIRNNKAVWYTNAGISKRLFNNKGNVSFRVSNIFNSRKNRTETIGENFSVSEVRSRNAARFSIGFSYKFDGRTAYKARNAQRSNRR